LYDHAHELLKTNHGSTVKLTVEENEGQPIFQWFYTCLKACKDNFMLCRPIIKLDGSFLKGKYGGELLADIGRDGNDQIMPIAYVVVEVENKESWTWFLKLLIKDLGRAQLCVGSTFICLFMKFNFVWYIIKYELIVFNWKHRACYQLFKIFFLEWITNFAWGICMQILGKEILW